MCLGHLQCFLPNGHFIHFAEWQLRQPHLTILTQIPNALRLTRSCSNSRASTWRFINFIMKTGFENMLEMGKTDEKGLSLQNTSKYHKLRREMQGKLQAGLKHIMYFIYGLASSIRELSRMGPSMSTSHLESSWSNSSAKSWQRKAKERDPSTLCIDFEDAVAAAIHKWHQIYHQMAQQAKSVQPSFHEVLDEFGPAGRLSDSHPPSPNTLQNLLNMGSEKECKNRQIRID